MTAIDAILMAAGFVAGAGIDVGAARYARGVEDGAGESTVVTKLLSGAAGAGAAVLAVWLAPAELRLFTAAFGGLLLALANIDFRTRLLPNLLNAALLLLGAAMVFLARREEWLMHAAGAVIGFSVLWAVETGYRQLRRRDGLGRGDAKLLGAIGMWVGAMGLPIVLLIASLSGIAAALIQSWRSAAPIGAATAIAFGPWIALGGFAVWLLQFTAQQFLGY
jgi:leader peptidase (prepilin peptidase) / N-methyltransferase